MNRESTPAQCKERERERERGRRSPVATDSAESSFLTWLHDHSNGSVSLDDHSHTLHWPDTRNIDE
jgi:hypothetical protein